MLKTYYVFQNWDSCSQTLWALGALRRWKADDQLTWIEEEPAQAAVHLAVVLTGVGSQGEQAGVGALLRQLVPPLHVCSRRPGIAEGCRAVVEPVTAARVGQVRLLATEHTRVVGQHTCCTVTKVYLSTLVCQMTSQNYYSKEQSECGWWWQTMTMATGRPYPQPSKLKCCFTSTDTVGLLGTGAQDVHLDFHTAPELWT